MAGVLDALASYVLNMLTEMAKEEVHILLRVTGEIGKMDAKLKDLKNFLADADRRNITDLSVQAWVKELRDAMYCATDIVDLCQLKAMEQRPHQDMGCFNPLVFCMRNPLHAHDIGRRIKKLNETLDDIKARSASFNFINLGSYEDRGRNFVSPGSSIRETSGMLDVSGLVGEKIEDGTRTLVEMLTTEYQSEQECNKIIAFAIVGVDGIGKTTLAQNIFNNDIIQQEFTKKIWLSVNQDFNETEILRRVITGAGGDHHAAGNSKATLEQTLTQALKGNKFLLIMDDVWDYRAWEAVLKTPMMNAALAHGSRVLVTTRHDTVAHGMLAQKPYHRIRKLESEDAWLLLKKQVIRNVTDEPHLELLKDIGLGIIEKCDGLPLAIKVMGGLLRQKIIRRVDWEKVLNDSLWSASQMPKELNNALYLSYEDLHPGLKPCFLHYSLLPKSTVSTVNKIVGMWISEGFVNGDPDELEELGREYYDELIHRNLIEPVTYSIDQSVCNMHDVVRSFAEHVARHEALVAHNCEIYKHHSQKLIRLSLDNKGSNSNDLEWCSLQAHTSLRTLIAVGNIKVKPGDSLLSFSSLRTLHLEQVNFEPLAESLCQLKHLRYVSIENSNTSRFLENIGKLKFLQHISLRGCKSLVKLPSSIGALQHLRCIQLNGTRINNIPRGFGSLTSLRKLFGFPAHVDGDRCTLEELGPLSHLRSLSIRFMENVSYSSFSAQARLGEKKRLRFMRLSCTSRLADDGLLLKEEEGITENELRQIEDVFDELCPPPCLENLEIDGYFGQRLPRWMMATPAAPLGTLRYLMMEELNCCTELPNGLCQLPFLEFLQIKTAPAIKVVGHEFMCYGRPQLAAMFPRLLELRFIGMVEWEAWEWEKQVQAMPVLELLHIERCKLRHVPPGLANHARALKELYIYDVKQLSSLEDFPSVVHLDVFENTDLVSISNLPKLQKLVIVNCPKMKVLEGMPSLQRLHLQDYDMETVPRYLQDVKPRHLLLDCSLSLLTCIAAGKSGPEWDRFNHIQQVKAYANDEGFARKWNVLYTRDPFRFETKISRLAIAEGRRARAEFHYRRTCPIEGERLAGQNADGRKCLPLCLRFRCNAYRHLAVWLREAACLHCSEAESIASSANQWVEASILNLRARVAPSHQRTDTWR